MLKDSLSEETINEMSEICQAAENVIDASDTSIKSTEEMITRMNKIQEELGSDPEPTAFIYMERIIHFLQVYCKKYIYNSLNNKSSTKFIIIYAGLTGIIQEKHCSHKKI